MVKVDYLNKLGRLIQLEGEIQVQNLEGWTEKGLWDHLDVQNSDM